MAIVLYALDGCPYCEKVHDALSDANVDYETEWVEALHSKRNEVKRISGRRSVPVLVDEEAGVTMTESENILTYVLTSLHRRDGPTTSEGRGDVDRSLAGQERGG